LTTFSQSSSTITETLPPSITNLHFIYGKFTKKLESGKRTPRKRHHNFPKPSSAVGSEARNIEREHRGKDKNWLQNRQPLLLHDYTIVS
jgi:hypothetical protein